MQAFQVDTSLWPVPPDSVPSSHHARHMISRRALIGGAAGAVGAALATGVLWPATGSAAPLSNPAPRVSPNTTTLGGIAFHFVPFGPGADSSSITDFNGFVGVADVRGTGTGTNPDGTTETLLFDTDMRFMKGVYVGKDGAVHRGTFGFV